MQGGEGVILLPIFHREEFKNVSLRRINLSSGLRWRCQCSSKSLGLPGLFTRVLQEPACKIQTWGSNMCQKLQSTE